MLFLILIPVLVCDPRNRDFFAGRSREEERRRGGEEVYSGEGEELGQAGPHMTSSYALLLF